MTNEQFEECLKNNTPVYQVWFKGTTRRKKKCNISKFGLVQVMWLNTSVVHSCDLGTYFMYVTSDNINNAYNKILNKMYNDAKYDLNQAKRNMDKVNKLKAKINSEVNANEKTWKVY